jgi:hypothetical protein
VTRTFIDCAVVGGSLSFASRLLVPSGSATAATTGGLAAIFDQVEVDDDEIRIWGRKGVLERLVAASGGSSPAGVPSFVRKWRARGDSNL